MREITDIDYSRFFKVAAVYNFFAALFFLAFPGLGAELMLRGGTVTTFPAHMFYNITWAFVLIFGIGYYIVALDVDKNHGVVVIGIIGKLFFYFYFLYLFLRSQCTLFGLAGVSGDLLFSMMFAYFLYKKRS